MALGFPVILVVGMTLGCLNHALLTVESIRNKSLSLAGWVANGIESNMEAQEDNIATLKQRILADPIAQTKYYEHVDR